MFAAKIYIIAATKLTATMSARKAMNDIRDQIKQANTAYVGIYNPTTQLFTNIPDGSPQIGNALYITNKGTTFATCFYMDQVNSNLSSVQITAAGAQMSTLSKIVVYITNYYVFNTEDSYTNTMTTYENDHVFHIKFQFAQWEYPLAGVVGQNAMYDYYQLQTRVTRRLYDY